MEDWQPDYVSEYISRIKRIDIIRADVNYVVGAKAYYATRPVEFIEHFTITYDPRNKFPLPKRMPFILFKRQREFVEFLTECVDESANGLVEKSRDMGATWLCCAYTVWLWLFGVGAAIGWGSRKEMLVDRIGDPDSIFEKLRMIINNLPAEMLPRHFNADAHMTYMKILNPETGATITGESGKHIGRGGRKTIFFKDESAHYESPEMIESALGDNTDVQIDISSVNGSGNVFYRRRHAGVIWRPGKEIEARKTRVFIMDWRDHPLKTQEWHDTRKATAEAEGLLHIFNQEVNRDYTGSKERIIIPQEWVRAAIDAHIKLGIAPEGAKIAGQDVADGGADKNSLIARHGIVCIFAEHWGGDAGEAARRAIPQCTELGVTELYYDSVGIGTGFKVAANTMKKEVSYPRHLKIWPWNGGATPLDPTDNVIPNDPNSPLNKDQYGNLKAQAWFRVRARFYKTYRAVNFGDKYPADQLISIDSRLPNLHQLTTELSQPVRKNTGEGKTIVDKSPDGTPSPNLADGFIMCYNPTRTISIFDVL
jgi:hypothetical protein